MSAFTDLVEKNLTVARDGLAGRAGDPRVQKAAKPLAQQIDQPQGLGNTPPAQQAHDMYEGVDLTSPNMLNGVYQRYGPAFVHAAVRKYSARDLRKAAKHPDLHPRVATILHAAAAVRKAFEGGNPMLGGPAQYPNSTPSVGIPARPSHGQPGQPVSTYPATVVGTSHAAPTATANPAAVTHEPQTVGAVSHTGGTDLAVARQWCYDPAAGNPVNMPSVDANDYGVGDTDSGTRANSVGQPSVGDLVHFNGPGGAAYQAKVTQVTTGAVIGEFAGQTVTFPTDGITPHRIGGADRATDGSTPAGLSTSAGGSGVGLGAKADGVEFGVKKEHIGFAALQQKLEAEGHDPDSAGAIAASIGNKKYGKKRMRRAAKLGKPANRVKKSQRDAIYSGGQPQTAPTGAQAGIQVRSPDDGALLTPYNAGAPYSPEEGQRNGAAPGVPVQGSMTARERALIERVVSHRGPMPTESAALKALDAGHVTDEHRQVLKRALADYVFAVPAFRAAARDIAAKL